MGKSHNPLIYLMISENTSRKVYRYGERYTDMGKSHNPLIYEAFLKAHRERYTDMGKRIHGIQISVAICIPLWYFPPREAYS